jgi:sortase A
VRGWGSWSARRDIARFESALPAASSQALPGGVDMALWSDSRIRHYRQSLGRDAGPAIGVLRIAKIGLEVPILEGTDELTLDRGVGHIVDTDAPGGSGNVGIAGHRDGFFRGLKDVGVGDVIELRASSGVLTYVVAEVRIVDPNDVSVLGPTTEPSITLVTCYPFYFVGAAPRRYVVRAIRR